MCILTLAVKYFALTRVVKNVQQDVRLQLEILLFTSIVHFRAVELEYFVNYDFYIWVCALQLFWSRNDSCQERFLSGTLIQIICVV